MKCYKKDYSRGYLHHKPRYNQSHEEYKSKLESRIKKHEIELKPLLEQRFKFFDQMHLTA